MSIKRRSLLTGSAIAALAGLQSRAEADTAFTSFAFAATGEPAARTMPDRLAEIKNVMDFGAVGDGYHDDTTNIQNAVNWTTGANRGTIYFPLGTYKITAPITFNYNGSPGLSICFRGEGTGSVINPTGFSAGAGYAFDRHLATPNNTAQVIIEKIALTGDGSPTGAFRLGSCNSILVRDVITGGGLTTEDSAGNSSQNFLLQNCKFIGGIVIGGTGSVQQCNFINTVNAITAYGNGFCIEGCRIENCGTCYLLGVDSSGTDQGATGFALIGGTTEGNWLSFDFAGTCKGFYLGSIDVLGHDFTNAGPNSSSAMPFGTYTYNSGTGLVTLNLTNPVPSALVTTGANIGILGTNVTANYTINSYAINSPSTGYVTLTMATTPDFSVNAEIAVSGLNIAAANVSSTIFSISGNQVAYFAGTLAGSPSGGGTATVNFLDGNQTCVLASGSTVTYTAATGHSVSPSGGGNLGMGQRYGIWVRANKASYGIIQGMNVGNFISTAAAQVDAATSRAALVFFGCSFLPGSGGGANLTAPSNAYTAQFQQCNVNPIWTYSQLPTGGNVFEGDQFTISDALAGNCSDSACGWGANVTGGTGALHRLVRWNGSNYTVVAK